MRTTAIIILAAAGLSACGGSSSRKAIQNKGSDTLVNVALAWAEHYKKVDPSVAVSVSGGGSGTGIAALINGTVHIANASREMKPEEIELALKNGVEPVQFVVGYDALAIFLHPKNPIESLTLAQLAAIYGDGGAIEKWAQLGIEFPEAQKDKIVRVSRQNNSGTYHYFKEAVLGKGKEYKFGSLDMHGSTDVADLVAKTPGAIGYSGLAYANEHVKVPTVAKDENTAPVAPSVDSAVDGSYPIARPLFMYTAGQPTGEVKKYLDWILSDEGQRIILELGYAPVKALAKD